MHVFAGLYVLRTRGKEKRAFSLPAKQAQNDRRVLSPAKRLDSLASSSYLRGPRMSAPNGLLSRLI